MNRFFRYLCLGLSLILGSATAAVPHLLNHQGRIAVSGVNFEGAGQFKFALVNAAGTTSYWSNDGTSAAGSEPTAAVSLTVTKGLYSVLLGDTTLANMSALVPTVFANDDVRLRVWFNDGVNGFELISPDYRLAAAPWAIVAINATTAASADIATTAGSAASFTGPLAGDVTGTQGATVVGSVAGSSAANVNSAELLANAATDANTADTIVKRDASGSFAAGTITGNLNGNAATATSATNAASATTADNATTAGSAASFTGPLAGEVTGTQGATVVGSVGGSSAANVNSAELLANAATDANIADTIVKRDASGNFAAGTITGNLNGNAATAMTATSAASATNFTGTLSGDVTGIQTTTAIADTTVTGKLLTGFASAPGTVTETDTILTAINKLSATETLLADIVASPLKPVVAWGDNSEGQTTVPTLSNVSAVAAGSTQSLALLADGTITTWGTGTSVPGGLTNVTDIAAGTTHFLARKSDGIVAAWGDDTYGQSADQGLTTATKVAAGEKHSIALLAAGTVTAWGDNSFNQTTIPGGLSNVTAIAAGYDHNLALKADGTVVAWGRDDAGQVTGTAPVVGTIVGIIDATRFLLSEDLPAATNDLIYNGTLTISSTSDGSDIVTVADTTGLTPGMIVTETGIVSPGGLTNIIAIAAGAYHSLALKDDGTVIAWGWNSGGQSTPPPGLMGVTAISGGYAFSIALKSDGTLVIWGDNSDGQTIIPQDATQVTAIAAGASHALALRATLIPAQVARLDQDNVFTGNIGIKRSPATNALEVEGQASKTTAGNWLANSDRRIKTEVETITGALSKLDQIRLVDFRYTDDYLSTHPSIEDKRYLNVIAQEFAEVFPDDVKNSGEFLPDGSPILQVDTYPLTIYSAAAVQELHRENQALKAKLADQEQRLRKLEAIVNP